MFYPKQPLLSAHKLFVVMGFLLIGACGEREPNQWMHEDGRSAGDPVILYSGGSIYDQSFNESVFRVIESMERETGLSIRHIAGYSTDIESDIPSMLEHEPALVVGLGYDMSTLVNKIAGQYPHVRFLVVDMPSSHVNVKSITFRDEESVFLAGYLAASLVPDVQLGLISGMKTPATGKIACAFLLGAQQTGAQSRLLYGVVGDTAAAWQDMTTPVAMSRAILNRDVDVLLVTAGLVNTTLHKIFRGRADVHTVSVDVNRNSIAPGSIMTSVVKDAGLAVVDALEDIRNGDWKNESVTYGLKDKIINIIFDQHNAAVVPVEVQTEINKIKADIMDGRYDKPLISDTCESHTDYILSDDPDVKAYLEY